MLVVKDRYVSIKNPTKEILSEAKKDLTIANPAYSANKQMGISNFATAKTLQYYEYDRDDDVLKVPVGYWQGKYHYIPSKDNRSDHVSEIIPTLEFKGTLRPEQAKAVVNLSSYTNGVLSAPTGSGKTVIALALIKRLQRKTLFIVDTIELANQFKDRCQTFLGFEPGLIGSGKFEVKDISVGILKTLTMLDEGSWRIINESFGCAILDEAHICPAAQFFAAFNHLNSKFKYGLSATVHGRKDKLTKVIFWGIGPERHEIPLEVSAKDLTIPEFEFIESQFEFPIFNPREYGKLLEHLSVNEERNQLIVDVRAKYGDKKCIILVSRREHASILADKIPGALWVASQGISSKIRKERMDAFLKGDAKTLIGTFKLLAKGLDASDIDMAIIAAPTNSEIDTKQLIGRTMRKGVDKHSIIIDIQDPLVGMLDKMATNRKRWYKKYISLGLKNGQT